jgi:hypothetical protein
MLVVAIFCVIVGTAAGEEQESWHGADDVGDNRHRIDFGAIFLDGLSTDSLDFLVGYTYNLTSRSNLSISMSYINPDLQASGDSGIGDTTVALSYVPKLEISANPWVPKTVGSGFAVLAPTGSASAGRSLDSWVLAPYLGFILPLSESFFVAPQLGYVHSLDETITGTDLRLGFGELGFGYVSQGGFWTSYFPQLIRDWKSDESAINHRISVGKMVSRSFGLSLDYVNIQRFEFGKVNPKIQGSDEQIELNVHFTWR